MNFKNILLCVLFSFCTISCSSLLKKLKGGDSDIEGDMAGDIVSQDMDADQRGSDSGDIKGLSSVFFAYDTSVLSESVKETLRENVEWIKDNSRVSRVELEGHCDPMGSEAYNVGLGLRRARAVKMYLISLGVSEGKFSIVSYGEERPLSQTDNSKNRRVNFVPIY